MKRHDLTECIALACLLEATAPKPGNVHRGADFEDLAFPDFVVAAVRCAPHLAAAAESGVGPAAYQALVATQAFVPSNVNLGIILLIAPLAAVPRHEALPSGVLRVLAELSANDSRYLWQTIQQARPGGLGTVATYDLAGPAPDDILLAMRAGAAHDLIAAQYANGFRELLSDVVPRLQAAAAERGSLLAGVIHTHVALLAQRLDSLIVRKAGEDTARQVREFAQHVVRSEAEGSESYQAALADFDFWLRADGKKRNPGTTADFLAAALFCLLRDELVSPPYR
jgi:triphosphoribosyl-dephospho-CoA synthase